MKKITRTENES